MTTPGNVRCQQQQRAMCLDISSMSCHRHRHRHETEVDHILIRLGKLVRGEDAGMSLLRCGGCSSRLFLVAGAAAAVGGEDADVAIIMSRCDRNHATWSSATRTVMLRAIIFFD